jgi:glycosyltransferase involved in cell wall biosynthesis
MRMTLPSVSVVIPTCNRRSGLPTVIDAIAADPHATEMIVVVDGCDDGSLQYLQERAASDPRIKPVWQENAGDRAARQRGVETATNDIVLLLDDDVVAGPDLARKHAERHAGHPNTVVVGYMPTTTRTPRRAGDYATHLYAEEYESRCKKYEADPGSILDHLWSGNISLPREAAVRISFTAGESVSRHTDQDFGLRCKQAGMSAVFDRALASQHSHSRNLESFLAQARQYGLARREINAAAGDKPLWSDPRKSLSRPRAAIVSFFMSGVRYVAGRALFTSAINLAGRAHLWKVETNLARLARQIELARGFKGFAT